MRWPFCFPSSLGFLLVVLGCGDSADATGGSAGSAGNGNSSSSGAAPSTGGTPLGGGGATAGGGTGPGAGGEGGVDPWAGPVQSLAELDLGTLPIEDTVKFPIPDRALGITTLSESGKSGLIGIGRLRPPAISDPVIFNFEIPGTGLQTFVGERIVVGGSPLSDLTDAWPVEEGTWVLDLASDQTPTSARTRVFVRRTEDGAFHGGQFDVHVFIAPGVANEGYVNTVLSTLSQSYYGPKLGITLGAVTFHSLSNSFVSIADQAEYRSLLASSAGVGSAPAINLFVVGDFGGEIDNALGVAGGIPGSPMVHGTTMSGVAYTPTGDTNYDASILAHEIGHLGGLFHTTESAVEAQDPFADTPSCANIQNPQSCPDISNVMFPIAYGAENFSPLQVRTLQGSALYRGVLQEGGAVAPPLLPALGPVPSETPLPIATLAAPGPWPQVDSSKTWLLAAHWCAHSGDVAAQLWQSTFSQREVELLELASSHENDLVRARALRMLARFATSSEVLEQAEDIARSTLQSPSSGARRFSTIAAARLLTAQGEDPGTYLPKSGAADAVLEAVLKP